MNARAAVLAQRPAGEGAAGTPPADVIDYLARRFSVGPKFLAPPAPTDAQWAQAAAVALRAPDHGGLAPFRFVVVADRQRPALAELFAQDARRRGHAPDAVEKARARAHNGPGLVAVVGRLREGVPDVPPHEQWLCIGAGLMNFLNALHLMGFGAKTLSGASVRDAAIRAAFCEAGETLVAWVVAGTPLRAPRPVPAERAQPVIGPWRRA